MSKWTGVDFTSMEDQWSGSVWVRVSCDAPSKILFDTSIDRLIQIRTARALLHGYKETHGPSPYACSGSNWV